MRRSPQKGEDKNKDKERTKTMKKNMNRNGNRKAKLVIREELVSSPDEEWTEFRIYRGKPKDGFAIASFKRERKAAAFVKKAA